jgi:hypothetical protein
VDANLRKEITESMNGVHGVLAERVNVENAQSKELTKLQQELARSEVELSELEHAHRIQTEELRKKYEMTRKKIRDEIDQLDRRRIQILRKNTNIFRRLFRKSDNAVAETGIALDSKRAQLRNGELNLRNDLRKRQEDYAAKRRRLLIEIDSLRQKIHVTEAAGDDALEVRREACRRIHAAITDAARRTQTDSGSLTSSS